MASVKLTFYSKLGWPVVSLPFDACIQKRAPGMRVQSAPSLPALAAGNEEDLDAASEGLEVFVCTRK